MVNSLALKLGGVDKQTPQPYGGRIEKDEKTGEPTGRLLQYPAEDLVRRMIPKLSVEQYEEAVRHAADLFLPYGITSVQDVIVYMREHTKIYEQMAEKADPSRAPLYPGIHPIARSRPGKMAELHHHFHNPMCTFGGWKLAIDGGPPAGTALMYDKSQLGSRRAFPLHKPEEFNKIVEVLHESGLQISIHVVGDEGMDICLDAFEKARHQIHLPNVGTDSNMPISQPRGILTGCKNWGSSPVSSPRGFIFLEMVYRRQMGEEIANRTIPNKSFLNRGIPVAFSSDVPATMVFEPFWGFIGAVTRRTRSGNVLVPSEAITMKEALRAYTHTAAYAAFEEKVKGSIEEGKFADLAVWEQNLYTVRPEPEKLKELKVLMTILNGKIVYQDEKAKLSG